MERTTILEPCSPTRPARASALALLVTEVACNPRFANWLFASPVSALDALRANPSQALGPGLPGPEFDVPALHLSDAERLAVISFQAHTLAELAEAVHTWQLVQSRVGNASRPALAEVS